MLEAIWLGYVALGIIVALVHFILGYIDDLNGINPSSPNYNCKWFYISCLLFAIPFVNLVYLGAIIASRVK